MVLPIRYKCAWWFMVQECWSTGWSAISRAGIHMYICSVDVQKWHMAEWTNCDRRLWKFQCTCQCIAPTISVGAQMGPTIGGDFMLFTCEILYKWSTYLGIAHVSSHAKHLFTSLYLEWGKIEKCQPVDLNSVWDPRAVRYTQQKKRGTGRTAVSNYEFDFWLAHNAHVFQWSALLLTFQDQKVGIIAVQGSHQVGSHVQRWHPYP